MSTNQRPLNDVVQYLQSLRDIDESETLLNSIEAEIKVYAVDLVCDQKGSKQMQRVMPSLKLQVLHDILIDGGAQVLCNKYASHVIESCLDRVYMNMTENISTASLLLNLVSENFDELIFNPASSPLIRQLVQWSAPAAESGQLKALFAKKACETSVLCHPISSPTIQAFLCADSSVELFKTIPLRPIINHPIGSHVAEVLIKQTASLSDGKKYFQEMFRQILLFISNLESLKGTVPVLFVLQSAISHIQDDASLVKLLELISLFERIENKSIFGCILQRICDKATDQDHLQQKAINCLKTLYGENNFLAILLTQDSQATLQTLSQFRIEPVGSVLACTISKFHAKYLDDVFYLPLVTESICSQIEWFFKSKYSCRVLESYIRQIPVILLPDVMNRIECFIPDLAIDFQKGGCFLVSALWRVSDTRQKGIIKAQVDKVTGLKQINYKLWSLCELGSNNNYRFEKSEQLLAKKTKIENIFSERMLKRTRTVSKLI